MGLFDPNTICPLNTIKLQDLVPRRYFRGQDGERTDRFISIFQDQFCQLLNDAQNLGLIIDADVTDERYLDLLISNLGFDLNIFLSVDKKRKLVKVVVQIYQQKGTKPGIENVIRQF